MPCRRNHPPHEQVRDRRGKSRCNACRRGRQRPAGGSIAQWMDDEPDPIDTMLPVRGAGGVIRWIEIT